jgi:hypothetical protein
MHGWQIFYRRNRQLLFRAGAFAAVLICGLLAFAPMPGSGADRTPRHLVRPSAFSTLLSPHRLETAAFVAQYLAAVH